MASGIGPLQLGQHVLHLQKKNTKKGFSLSQTRNPPRVKASSAECEPLAESAINQHAVCAAEIGS